METRLPGEIRNQLDRLTLQLVDEFGDAVAPEIVESRMRQKLETFRDARVLNFVPLLVYRSAREDLYAMRRRIAA